MYWIKTSIGAPPTETAPNFQAKTVVSDRLVTGQNPASAAGVGEQIVALFEQKLSSLSASASV